MSEYDLFGDEAFYMLKKLVIYKPRREITRKTEIQTP